MNDIEKIAQETLNHLRGLTSRDVLTGAYNRAYMERVLDSLINSGETFGLMLFDIDNFKKVNDTYGHKVGDKMLKHLVTLVGTLVEAEDVVCRYGGEEFVVIMPGVADFEILRARAKKIIEHFGESFIETDKGTRVSTTLSAGASVIDGTKTTKEEALSRVDNAMYEIKKSTKNGVQVI